MIHPPNVGDIITCGQHINQPTIIFKEFNRKSFSFPIESMVRIPYGCTALVLEVYTTKHNYVARVLVSNVEHSIGWIQQNKIIGVN